MSNKFWKLLNYTRYAGIFAVGLIVFFQTTKYPNMELSMLFVAIGSIILAFSTFAYFMGIYLYPSGLLIHLFQLKILLKEKKINYALYSYETIGPSLIFHYGFDFFEQKDFEEEMLNLGITGMVLLGNGEDYIESTIILPIENEEYIGIGISFWGKDPSQKDMRFKGRTFFLLLFAFSNELEWIVYKRKVWQQAVRSYVSKLENAKEELTPERVEGIIHTVIHSIFLDNRYIIDTYIPI